MSESRTGSTAILCVSGVLLLTILVILIFSAIDTKEWLVISQQKNVFSRSSDELYELRTEYTLKRVAKPFGQYTILDITTVLSDDPSLVPDLTNKHVYWTFERHFVPTLFDFYNQQQVDAAKQTITTTVWLCGVAYSLFFCGMGLELFMMYQKSSRQTTDVVYSQR